MAPNQFNTPEIMTNSKGKNGLFPGRSAISEILTVDDEPDIGLALTDLLNQEGYAVTAVETGQEALDLSKFRQFQAVILDLGLPDCDGLEVLDQLRRHDPWLPVIILTAYSPLERYMGQTEGSPAFAYLSKPFDRKKLKDTIRRALQYRAQKETEKISI